MVALIFSNSLTDQTILPLPLSPHPADLERTSTSVILEAPHFPGFCKGTWHQGTELKAWSKTTRDHILPLPLTSFETLRKLLTLSVSQLPHLYSGNNSIYLMGLLRGLNDLKNI